MKQRETETERYRDRDRQTDTDKESYKNILGSGRITATPKRGLNDREARTWQGGRMALVTR